MSQKIKNVLKAAVEQNVEMVDLKFCDLFGRWHHITIPVSQFDESIFKVGVAFDGSSIPGFKRLEGGDMVLVPDTDTMLIDEFWEQKTLSFICSAYEADTLELFNNDPRNVAFRAEQYLKKTGIADESLWSPEFEFRPPDATCNMYLSLSALLMAGIDGVKNKIDPEKEGFGPYDVNVFTLPKSKLDKIKSLPTSLFEAAEALKKDHKFLLEGGIFSDQLIETWIDQKLQVEYDEVRNRPHPYEMSLYYDV